MLSIDQAKERFAQYRRAADQTDDPDLKSQYEEAAQTLKRRILASGELGKFDSAAEGALQGVTFGLSDELAGVGSAFMSLFNEETVPEAYSRSRDASRAEDELYRDANSGSYMTGEIASGFLVPGGAAVGGARALRAANTIRSPLMRAAVGGAGSGSVAGYGYSEGDTAGEIAADTATGAAVGGVLGPAVGAAAKKGAELGTQFVDGARRALAPDPQRVAQQRARRVLQDEGISTPEQARMRLDEMGPEGRLSDLGPAARQEAVGVAKSGGEARRIAEESVQARQRGQEPRIRRMVQEVVDPKWTDSRGFKKQLSAERIAQSDDAYAAAYAKNVKPTQRMAQLTKNDYISNAMNTAEKRLRNKVDVMDQAGTDLTQDGEISTRLLDETMRVLRDKANKLYRKGDNGLARDVLNAERALKKEVFASNKELERAMSIYRGAQELEEAADFGKGLLSGKRTVDDYLDIAENFSDSEVDAFRVGLMDGMINKLQDAAWSGDSGRQLIPNTRVKGLLREVFKKADDAGKIDELVNLVEREADFQSLRNKVVGGSITAETQIAQGASRAGRQDQTMLGLARDIFDAIAGDNPEFSRLKKEEYAELAKIMFGEVSDADLEDIIYPTLRTKISGTEADSAIPMMTGQAATTSVMRSDSRPQKIRDVATGIIPEGLL